MRSSPVPGMMNSAGKHSLGAPSRLLGERGDPYARHLSSLAALSHHGGFNRSCSFGNNNGDGRSDYSEAPWNHGRRDRGGTARHHWLTKFFTITLTNVLLTKLQTEDSENEVLAGPEQINLNYERFQLKDEVTGESACWDVLTARSC